MQILDIILLALGLSSTYILITLITSYFSYKELKLPDLINWRIVVFNALLLAILFFLLFWLLPLLFSTLALSDVVINVLLFLIIAVVPTYEYLITPLLIVRNKKLFPLRMSKTLIKHAGRARVYGIHKNFANAFAIGVLPNSKTIIVSNDLIAQMNQTELDGIIAHEQGHLKYNHLFKLYLSALFALMLGYISTFYFYPLLENMNFNIHVMRAVHGAFFYGVPMWLIPAFSQRVFEYQADSYAAKIVGKENYVGSLTKLDKLTKGAVEKGGMTHPSLKKRINRLNR